MNKRLSFGLCLLAITLVAAVSLVFTALAAPPVQDGLDLPTPTMPPVENVAYTLERVGGSAEPWTFTHEPVEGFTFGETVATSFYPAGMTFTTTVESGNGEITNVLFVFRQGAQAGTRAEAVWDSAQSLWVASPWADGGQPAWTEGQFFWRVTDAAGNTVETAPQRVAYYDSANQWFRMESDHIIMYWYGFAEDDPDTFARTMAEIMASLYPRWVEGFGRYLSYKPLAIVYPSTEAYGGMYLSGIMDPTRAGTTEGGSGLTTQTLRHAGLVQGNENCVWALKPEEWTMERRIATLYNTIPHEVTHLVQFDVMGQPRGLEWWTEGQAEYFSGQPGLYDRRLRHLATLQNIADLHNPIGSSLTQADGCYALAYDVGPSFINFLLTNYGGLETHRQIIDLQISNVILFDAIEQVTGKPFMEIENEWRTYLGFPALALADVDPAAALEPYEDSLIKVGDTVTLPAMPSISMMYQDPKPNALISGSCFGNAQVEILAMGQLDGIAYFKVDCMGQIGWMTRDSLVAPE
jgi:hypothetical protein